MPTDLRTLVTSLVANKECTWTELAQGIDKSKATISLWAANKYTGNNSDIAGRIEQFLRGREAIGLSFRDSLKLTSLLATLDETEDPKAVIAALTRYRA